MSIVEVAKQAGVSKSTVSRVINNLQGVAEPLRVKVLQAMEELQYRPSPRRPGPKPASRRQMRTGNILMAVAGYDASEIYRMPVFPAILHGSETAIAEAGMNLVIAGLRADRPLPAVLSPDQVDGVLCIGSHERLTSQMRQALDTIPTVVLLRSFDQFPGEFDRVLFNNAVAGPLAARYLISRGHRHAAFVSTTPNHIAFEQRRIGFADAFGQADRTVLELVEAPADDGNDAERLMVTLSRRIGKAHPAITAICVGSDAMLPSLYRGLHEVGLRPMRDLDIVSCDNDAPTLASIHPTPATVDIRAEHIGHLAVRQLLWRLQGMPNFGPITVMVEPILIPAAGSRSATNGEKVPITPETP